MISLTGPSVSGLVLDNMIASNQLESMLREQVYDILMARHKHQNEKRVRHKEESRIHLPFVRSLADIGKKYSEPKALASQGETKGGLTIPGKPAWRLCLDVAWHCWLHTFATYKQAW